MKNSNITKFLVFLGFISFFCASFSLQAQLTKEWELHVPTGLLNGPSYSPNSSQLLKTLQTPEGDFITLGIEKRDTTVYPLSRIKIFKFSPNGQLLWTCKFQGQEDFNEQALDMEMLSDGSVVVGGSTTSFLQIGFEWIEYTDFLLFRLGSDGNFMWSRTYAASFDRAYCQAIEVTPQDEIYTLGRHIIGIAISTVISKFDINGSILLQRGIDSHRPAFLESHNNQFFVFNKEQGVQDLVYIFDDNLNITRSYPMQGLGRYPPEFDKDGNYYINRFDGDFGLTKYDINGNRLWRYDKPTNLPNNVTADELMDYHVDANLNVYVTGRHYGPGYNSPTYTNCNVLTAKLDPQGSTIWEHTYQYDTQNSCQVGNKLVLADNGEPWVVGYQSVEKNGDVFASTDMVMLHYTDQGQLLDSIYYDGQATEEDVGINMFFEGSDLYLLGYSEDADSLRHHSIIKYGFMNAVADAEEVEKLFVYPNPSVGELNIVSEEDGLLEVFEMAGRIVERRNVGKGEESLLLDEGSYILRLVSEKTLKLARVVVE